MIISKALFLFGITAAGVFLLQLGVHLAAQENRAAPPAQQAGGDIIPLRQVSDPYPVFNGIAVDPVNNVVAMSDVNRKSLMSYSRSGVSSGGDITSPRRQLFGPLTNVGCVAGILLDPQRKEILAVNNDIEDTMIVVPYDAQGNAAPTRLLSVPHQAWGLAMRRTHDPSAVTVEIDQALVIYKRDAKNVEPPMRRIRGPNSGLADPHARPRRDRHNEIGVA